MSTDRTRRSTTRSRQAATSGDLVAMLRRHYLPDPTTPGGIFAAEIAAPASNRRADVIWQGLTSAGGHELVGHEIKVTRGDLAAELADLTKSDPWQRYCDRWWLVVPDPELVDGLELPVTWGVMTPPSGRRTRSMTLLRAAPKLFPTDQGPGVRVLAARMQWLHQRAAAELDAVRAHRDQAEQRARDAEARAPHPEHSVAGARAAQRDQVVAQIVEQVVDALGVTYGADGLGAWGQQVRVEDVIAALRDIGAARAQAAAQHRELARSTGLLRDILASVDRGRLADLAATLDPNPNPNPNPDAGGGVGTSAASALSGRLAHNAALALAEHDTAER